MKKIGKLLAKKKIWLVLLAALLIGGGFWWKKSRLLAKKEKGIKTAVVKKGDIVKTISLNGHVDAHEKTTLKFQTSGLLVWVGVKEGDWVKKGQAIASLDKRKLKKTLSKEMNDYLKSRWDWEQGREDYDYENRWFELSDAEKRILEKNQFDLNNAVADVEIADLAVRLATITAPIDGIVTKIESPYPGVNITPATAEFEIVNPKTVYFYAEADEEDVVGIKKGMKVTVSLDAYPGREFKGIVSEINFAPAAATGSPSYPVKIDFIGLENNDLKLRLNMEGEGEIKIASADNVLVIPLGALRGSNEDWVYLVSEDGKKQKRLVKKGIESDELVEITAGLKEGETLLVE